MSRYGRIDGRIHSYLPLENSSLDRRWGSASNCIFLNVQERECKVVRVHVINYRGEGTGIMTPIILNCVTI
jgi:hypothetical protein